MTNNERASITRQVANTYISCKSCGKSFNNLSTGVQYSSAALGASYLVEALHLYSILLLLDSRDKIVLAAFVRAECKNHLSLSITMMLWQSFHQIEL